MKLAPNAPSLTTIMASSHESDSFDAMQLIWGVSPSVHVTTIQVRPGALYQICNQGGRFNRAVFTVTPAGLRKGISYDQFHHIHNMGYQIGIVNS
jgi:hypothetical protein